MTDDEKKVFEAGPEPLPKTIDEAAYLRAVEAVARRAKRIREIVRDNNLPDMVPNANDVAEAEIDYELEEVVRLKRFDETGHEANWAGELGLMMDPRGSEENAIARLKELRAEMAARCEAAAPGSPFGKPIEEWTKEEMAEDERTCQGIPARAHHNRYMAEKKARTYRIPVELGQKLWELAEGQPLASLRVEFHGWKKGTLSDKDFLVVVEEYLATQGKIQKTFASVELLRAWYDSTGAAVEWTEPPAPEDDLPF